MFVMPADSPIEFGRKKVNLKGGTFIDGFPGVGLAYAIASEWFAHSLTTELVAILRWAIEECELVMSADGLWDDYTQEEYDIKRLNQ
ncbi:MAG: hypothetical protein DLM72_05055 [Candidatus Nitrosopolaris wilkensis]|nr:MAG: hypothetical protein DLM72_05055 [Candidatus Nitrosopolaris wilkensis]